MTEGVECPECGREFRREKSMIEHAFDKHHVVVYYQESRPRD